MCSQTEALESDLADMAGVAGEDGVELMAQLSALTMDLMKTRPILLQYRDMAIWHEMVRRAVSSTVSAITSQLKEHATMKVSQPSAYLPLTLP